MLVRTWSSRIHPLLAGMHSGPATLEDGLTVPYKTKYALTLRSSEHTAWYLPKLENYVHTKICTWMFMEALFIIQN